MGNLNEKAIIAAQCSVKGLVESQAELLSIPPPHKEINLLSPKPIVAFSLASPRNDLR